MFARGYASGAVTAGRGGEPHPDALIVEAAIAGLWAAIASLGADRAALFAALVQDIGLAVDAEGALEAALRNAANLTLAFGRMGQDVAADVNHKSRANRFLSSDNDAGISAIAFGNRPIPSHRNLHHAWRYSSKQRVG